MKKSFKESYKKHRNTFTITNKGRKRTNVWTSFLYACDDILTGHKLYDFYYHKIYVPLWRLFFHYPKVIKTKTSIIIQRGTKGIAKQDVWGLSDYILEITYKGVKIFLEDEYGKEPIVWSKRSCETHDLTLYKDLRRFVFLYEELLGEYERDFRQEDLARTEKLSQDVYKSFKKIVSKHFEKLWT